MTPRFCRRGGPKAYCSSATCSPRSSAAASGQPMATSKRYCAGSIRCRGGPICRPAICSGGSAVRLHWRATCASGPSCCGPAGRRWCADLSTGWRCIWQSRSAMPPIFDPPSRRCASCTAPASAIMISPRNRTGWWAATAGPISPTSSSRPAFARAAGCSGSRPTRTCVTS